MTPIHSISFIPSCTLLFLTLTFYHLLLHGTSIPFHQRLFATFIVDQPSFLRYIYFSTFVRRMVPWRSTISIISLLQPQVHHFAYNYSCLLDIHADTDIDPTPRFREDFNEVIRRRVSEDVLKMFIS